MLQQLPHSMIILSKALLQCEKARQGIPDPNSSENIKQCGVNTFWGLAMGIFWLWPRLQIINYVSENSGGLFSSQKSDIIHGALWQ